MRVRRVERGAGLLVRRRRQSKAGALRPATSGADRGPEGWVDVRDLIERLSIEELSQTAENYFARLSSWEPALAKPFFSMHEAPELLVDVGALLSGLELVHGMTVLDFGAGSGWLSWMLSQLGCRAILTDVSATALRIAEERYRRFPILGDSTAPTFLPFDGHRIALDDHSVDRVACNDAFHHVGNPAEVLSELARVLAPGGICVMAEPGPNHSNGPQAQAEMRNFRVVERDIVAEEIADQALRGGFDSVEVAVFCGLPRFVEVSDFPDATATRSSLPGEITRAFLENRRLIRLRKSGTVRLDSRTRTALAASLQVTVTEGRVQAQIQNTGRADWLQVPGQVGLVNLGVHLYDRGGRMVEFDFLHLPLQNGPDPIPPGASIEVTATLPPLPPGERTVEFDLVSEGVAWFAQIGNPTITVSL